jgi:hypothetical protein
MGRTEKYLAMTTDMSDSELIGSDLNELGSAARKLVNHAFHLSGGLSAVVVGTILLQSLASIAGIYLVVLSNTKLKTKMFSALLVPYIFCSIPNLPFAILSGEVGHYIAFVLTTIGLFSPNTPEWSVIPNALGLLLVIAPDFIAHTIREGVVGVLICLVIGCYLLQEHIRASGGFRNCFVKPHGMYNTLGLIFLVLYPIWGVIAFFL